MTRCGAAIQGDEVGHTGPAAVSYRFLGAAGIEEIRAFDHTGMFWRRDLHGELGLATGRVRVRFPWDRATAHDERRSCWIRVSQGWAGSGFGMMVTADGIGPVTASVLIASMPELGDLSRQAVASLAGLAPFNQDSGAMRGTRHIRGGRMDVRNALYMATLTATRCNNVIREDFKRMLDNGKPHKVAMTACMRKLLIILNVILDTKRPWTEPQQQHGC